MKIRLESVNPALLMVFSALSFSIMAIFVRGFESIPVAHKIMARNLVMFVGVLIFIPKDPSYLFGVKTLRPLLILRALMGTIGIFLYFYSIKNLPLGESAMLNRLSPFATTLFAVLFLHEVVRKRDIAAMCLAFIGALFVVKPGFSFDTVPALAGVASAFAAGAAYATIRGIGKRADKLTIMLFFSAISSVVTLPWVMALRVLPSLYDLFILFVIGVFAMLGQLFLTLSYMHGNVSKVSVYNYTTIVFSLVLGFFFFQELPDAYSLLGGGLIIAAALVPFLISLRKNKKEV